MTTPAQSVSERLRQLNRMFRTISLCGHHMIRAEDEQTLAQAICTVMVKDGGYRMA